MHNYIEDKKYWQNGSERLVHGSEISTMRNISFNEMALSGDINGLVEQGKDSLEQLFSTSMAKEDAIYNQIMGLLNEWEQHAHQTSLIRMAIQYWNVKVIKHSSNQWHNGGKSDREDFWMRERSNATYIMWYRVHVHTERNTPVVWELSWAVTIQSHISSKSGASIGGQYNKKFKSKEAMEKYLNGRIKAYEHLFQDEFPPIPQKYAQHFKIGGMLLPQYTIESESV